MNSVSKRSILSLIMALVLLLSITGCGGDKTPEPGPSPEPEPAPSKIFVNTLPPLELATGQLPENAALVKEKYDINKDTVGWLSIPNTQINDVVVWYPGDINRYYYRRNFQKEYYKNGIFYADYRTTYGENNLGSLSDLSNNICIYGHTMSADIDGAMFANLKYFENEEFARNTPYVYFSTQAEDMAWEVFAVMYAHTDLPYNRPDLTTEEWETTLNECIQRSIYNYDTQVSASDHVLTLSTCTYSLPGVGPISYPSEYRFVVMAKQVGPREAVKTQAEFEINPAPKAPR